MSPEPDRTDPETAHLAPLYSGLHAQGAVARALRTDFAGRTALVSSFGADSAVLLHMVAEVDRDTPVLFLQTGFHFPETERYRTALTNALGLRNVRVLHPEAEDVAQEDPDGTLHRRATGACCDLRKTRPLQRALAPYTAWITGRRRDQSGSRAGLRVVGRDGAGRIKLNPLAGWQAEDLSRYRDAAGLPPHPLVARGYPSIGCAPCTSPVRPGEPPRAGRWRGTGREECGIHLDATARILGDPAHRGTPLQAAGDST